MLARRVGKVNKASLTKQLDRLWRFAIKCRDDRIDQYTLHTKGVRKVGGDAHHIFSRKNKMTRWDTSNGIFVMKAHHWNVPHREPHKFEQFLVEKWFKSREKYEFLYRKSQMRFKVRIADYELIRLSLYSEIEGIIMTKHDKTKWFAEYHKTTRNRR